MNSNLIQDHPISLAQAEKLLKGDLGEIHRDILKKSCAPFYWHLPNGQCLNNGTMTFLRTPKKLLGVTAEHVLRSYEKCANDQKILRLMNAYITDLPDRIIDRSATLDLATIEIDEIILKSIGKEVVPLEPSPRLPQEGKGVMLAGYHENGRRVDELPNTINFGLFTCNEVIRRITNTQISIMLNRDDMINVPGIETLPQNYNLSGISGGPLIALFETQNYISYYRLAGIIVQQPDYENSDIAIERVIATRVDMIREDGKISNIYHL